MSWLRIDDGFALHPKVMQLSRAERWTWMEVLCYCARYETDGELPYSIREALPKLTPKLVEKLVDIGLLDRTDEPALHVHNWGDFNPARMTEDELDEAVKTFYAENPEASANEACKAIAAQRKAVLAAVKRFRSGSAGGSGNQNGTGTQVVPEPVTRAGARAQTVPSRPTEDQNPPYPNPAVDADADEASRRALVESIAAGSTHLVREL